MSEGIEVHFKGFKTRAQADAFVNWYSNSGEQDAIQDFECRKDEGSIDVTCMFVDAMKTFPLNTESTVIEVHLEMVE
jgi:hypothetical protein